MTAWRALSTVLLLITAVAAFAVAAPEALTVSPRLTVGYVLGPIIGWLFAFFGSRLTASGQGIANPAADIAFRAFGMLVLIAICSLLMAKWLE